MKNAVALIFVLLAAPAFANRADDQCSSPVTINTVKEVIREQMLPGGTVQRIPEPVFMTGTSVKGITPTRYDTELKIAECTGIFTVDASAGIHSDAGRAIEVKYARAPDLVLMLSLLLSQPPKGRVYDYQIAYSSQLKGGQNYVKVGGINDFKTLATAGFLMAKADQRTASPETQPKKQLDADPAEIADREFSDADKQLNVAYKRAMDSLSQEGKTRLRMEQRSWIGRRDKSCAQDPDAGIGPNSVGALEAIGCATKFTQDRTAELLKMAAMK